MPSPGAPVPSRVSIEDSYLELLAETLDTLDLPARGQFLQRYFRVIAHLDLREAQCLQIWDDMLARRRELSDRADRQISLNTALLDVLTRLGLLRVPILIEYEDLKKLQLNAVTDPLTDLYNRRLFAETFEKELNRARRYVQPLGLVMLDLHRFKEVNDKHGHPRGDEVLRAAAATLKKALRTSDYAFRIGGDEFALILPQTDAAQALALARRVETVFAEMLRPLQLTVSVSMDHGVANFPQDAEQAAPIPPPISIETRRAPEKTESAIEAAASATAADISANLPAPSPRVFAVQRKAERVSMTGTNAYAVLG